MYLCTHSPLAQAFGTSLFHLSVKTGTHINPKPDKGQRKILPWQHLTPAYASFCILAFCVTISVPAQRHVFPTLHQPVVSSQQAHFPKGTYLPCSQALYKCLIQKKCSIVWLFGSPYPPLNTSAFQICLLCSIVPSTLLYHHSSSMSVWTDIFSPYVSNISCIYPVILHTKTTAIPLLWLQDWTIVLSISQWQGV